MQDARAVANFFIARSLKEGVPISTMTLLKVLYFAHAWHLVKFAAPLIAQPFEAWRYGPVCRVVYEQFKKEGGKPIVRLAESLDIETGLFTPVAFNFDQYLQRFLNHILDYYTKFHPFTLSDLTHERGGPWEIIWSEAERRAVPGMIIPNDLIETWFAGKDSLYWTNQERSREI